MRIDDLCSYLTSNLDPYVSALSTPAVPLSPIPSTSIFTREYHDSIGSVSVSLVEGAESVEQLSLNTREIKLPVNILIQVTAESQTVMREQAANYAQAILNCFKAYPDFNQLLSRDFFDGVEANENIKAAKMELEFTYTEAI